MSHLLRTVEDQKRFLLAGNAKLTLVSLKTGNRFTYRVKRCENDGVPKPLLFVSVLTGPDNENSYSYFGLIRDAPHTHCTYHYGVAKAKIDSGAPSAVAFRWWFEHMGNDQVEVYHEGRCGRCGRTLTVPESIERGIGPECASIMGID